MLWTLLLHEDPDGTLIELVNTQSTYPEKWVGI
jgi:hypothetical protein